jgi:hypothetical protein
MLLIFYIYIERENLYINSKKFSQLKRIYKKHKLSIDKYGEERAVYVVSGQRGQKGQQKSKKSLRFFPIL